MNFMHIGNLIINPEKIAAVKIIRDSPLDIRIITTAVACDYDGGPAPYIIELTGADARIFFKLLELT